MPSPFELFGTVHSLTLLLIAALAALWIALYRSFPRQEVTLRTILAYCCLISFPMKLALYFSYGLSLDLESQLPLHLCDLAAFFGGIALLKKSPIFSALAYFWGLGGTLQGLLTPDLHDPFPSVPFLIFFWHHGVIVITALFLPLAMRWRPTLRTALHIWGLTQIYLVVAMLANYLLGTNYGYLRAKPQTASLLDLLPDWPWYILLLELICLGTFTLLALPFSRKSLK